MHRTNSSDILHAAIKAALSEHFPELTVTAVCRLSEDAFNMNFEVRAKGRKYFLKLYPTGSFDERVFEQRVLHELATPKPLPVFPHIYQERLFSVMNMPAMLFEFVVGKTPSATDLTPKVLRTIAASQSYLHARLYHKDIGVKQRFDPLRFDYLAYFGLRETDQFISDITASMQAEASDLKQRALLSTVIHDDISLDNILLAKNGAVTIIDFDDAHVSLRISDIGTAIKELIIDQYGLDAKRIRDYIAAYNDASEIGQLSAQELGALPFMVRRRALFMYAYYRSRPANKYNRLRISRQYATLLAIRNFIEL